MLAFFVSPEAAPPGSTFVIVWPETIAGRAGGANARLLTQVWIQLLKFCLENAKKRLGMNLLVACPMSSFLKSPESSTLTEGKEGCVMGPP